jgi:arylformamidase
VTDLFDITLTARADMPHWPGSSGLKITATERIGEGDDYNVSTLHSDLHVGTHVDAPWHCVENGDTVDRLPLEVLVGPTYVAHLRERAVITSTDLDNLQLPPTISRLLLRTDNSELWRSGVSEFRKDFVGLDRAAAEWVVRRGIQLLGTDYFSVEPYDSGPLVHRVLLGANVVLLEGLNLADVEPGVYELICLPIKLEGADGAPARAVLRTSDPVGHAPSTTGGEG